MHMFTIYANICLAKIFNPKKSTDFSEIKLTKMVLGSIFVQLSILYKLLKSQFIVDQQISDLNVKCCLHKYSYPGSLSKSAK